MPEVVAAFDAVARVSPDAIALMAEDAVMTFGALRDASLRLADRLAESGARAGDVIALMLGRSASHVIAMLAAGRVDAAFLPVDPSAPPSRVHACLEEAGACISLVSRGTEIVIDASPAGSRAVSLADDALAYVIYTSGSSGRPKGVRVAHDGLVPVLDAQIHAFGLGPGKRALLYLSTAFDASISDIGTSLLSGATLVIPRRPPAPRELAAYLHAFRVTHADLPPSLLPLVDPSTLPRSLETVIIGGEVCPPHVVRAWAGKTRVINVYGPTEATICTSLCECDADTWARPLLGEPLPHVDYRVEDDELWIGGRAVAIGYVDRPELDSSRFVTRDGKRYYRTGDLVRGASVRELEFVGRADRQVKIRGLLVSPEEIEAALSDVAGVAAAAVTVDQADGAETPRAVLTAHVVLRDGATDTPHTLRAALARALPRWMLPRVIVVPSLARALTGKIARGTLDVEGRSSVERRAGAIASAFSEVLGMGHVDVEDDFFALGGDSLAAFEVSSVAQLAGVTVEASAVLTHRTPTAIARTEVAAGRTALDLDEVAAREAASVRETPTHPDGAGDDWFLTGAAGFLGRQLLEGLLERTRATIHVLVRPGAPAVEQQLQTLSSRVRVHRGDVSAPTMGLTSDAWHGLATHVGHVVHAAAAVNLALPFDALSSSNVTGAVRAAELVLCGARKTLTYISTLSVLAATDLEASVIGETTRLAPASRLFGAYAQTKYVAESILRRTVPETLVIRPGLLTGDSRTGVSAPRCTLASFLRLIATVGAVPDGDHARLRVDITPIDHAVAVILELLVMRPAARVVHVASKHGASLEALVRAVRRQRPVCTVPPDELVARARAILPRDRAMALAGASYRLLDSDAQRDADLFLLTDRSFDCSQAATLTGLTCPTADDALLARYVDVALAGLS